MKNITYLVALLLTFGVLSCDSPGDATVDPPAELITDVLLVFKDSANMQDSVVARFSDPDGPTGSVQPTITGATLKGGRTYIGSLHLYEVIRDRQDSLIDVTREVRELDTQHQVFYTLEPLLQLVMTLNVTDKDANGLPLGLSTIVRTNAGGSGLATGKVNVVLSHYEQPGTKNGIDRSDESDVDIDFPITIF
jgi:hypothetical protein